jgi:hypothetical protein
VLARAAHRNSGDGHLTLCFVDFRNVDGSAEMLESGDTQSDSRILVVNSGGGQMRIKLIICSRARQRVVADKGHRRERTFCSLPG